ncbi:hypothetical protein JW979_15690 [bacterium]|nr:hypothetical protein [candidate division CSSED10-310 bacterium]
MKKSLTTLISLIGLTCFLSIAVAADRVVLFETFTEDECFYCGEVADAVDSFQNSYSRDVVAIITYSVNGSQVVPGGADRMSLYGEETVPVVVGDGLDNIYSEPFSESILINYFNSRTGVPSDLAMEVFHEGGSQYRVHLSAETSVNGALMAVAYQSITHENHPYPFFAREILTSPYGDDIALASGEQRDVVFNISCPAADGVVAWVHYSSKDTGRFRPSECFQAADSNASHTNPTPTPPEPTPTPPDQTPTPSPTYTETNLQQTLELNKDNFLPNDPFVLDVHTVNPEDFTVSVDQYLALEVAGVFFFWPEWSADVSYAERSYTAGYDDYENIFNFTWPSGVGSFQGIRFWLVSILSGTAYLAGPYDMVEWGYSQ